MATWRKHASRKILMVAFPVRTCPSAPPAAASTPFPQARPVVTTDADEWFDRAHHAVKGSGGGRVFTLRLPCSSLSHVIGDDP